MLFSLLGYVLFSELAKCPLSDADAAALKARGFQIRPGNIVEWVALSGGQFNFLLEWLLSLQARWRPLINEIGGLAIAQSKLATQSPSKKAGLRSVKVHPRDGRCGEVAVSGYPNPED